MKLAGWRRLHGHRKRVVAAFRPIRLMRLQWRISSSRQPPLDAGEESGASLLCHPRGVSMNDLPMYGM